jgi:multidrug efflux pump subunit AcrA (membrane-fusion protein)
MNASADVIVSRIPDAISIPAKALFTNKGKPVVYLKTKTGYDMRQVEVQARNPDDVAVKGLEAGVSVSLAEPLQTGKKP